MESALIEDQLRWFGDVALESMDNEHDLSGEIMFGEPTVGILLGFGAGVAAAPAERVAAAGDGQVNMEARDRDLGIGSAAVTTGGVDSGGFIQFLEGIGERAG